MLWRRELIGKAAVGAAAAVAVSAARTGVASARAVPAATNDPAHGGEGRNAVLPPADPPPAASVVSSPPPWELLSPLGAGSVVGHGWRLVGLGPVQDGSCVVTLQNARGRSHRVHLCRNDGKPQGIIYTRRVDLVVMNEGYGDLPTEERLAQAVAKLAHVIAANEARGPGRVTELLPHAERLRRFAPAAPPAGVQLR